MPSPELTSFVGRADDLARIRRLLSSGERVITLVGPPGIGKTRLAQELSAAAPNGSAAFCSLATARDVDGICRAVAAGLAVSIATTGSPVAQLARTLLDRRAELVVLDNVEQILGPIREALTLWRDFAPEIAFVVTSRERLQLRSEVVHELPNLGRVARGDAPSEALELLLDLVARAGRTYDAGDLELADLARIAERLEGLPLAIELVAPRVALLGARTVERKLAARSSLLSISTLRATLEWSWTLLTTDEQRALARCSVFVSGFNAAAAEALLGDDALDLLQALRKKSLLVVSPPPAERFGFAFSVRDLAAEKLDEMGLREPTELAHARWFADWAENAEENADTPAILRELALERENLLAASERSLTIASSEAIDRTLRTATALHTLAWSQGPFDAYEALLTKALDHVAATKLESRTTVWARTARAQARRRLGRREEAVRDLREAVAIAREVGDRRIEGRASVRLGVSLIDLRKFADGLTTLEHALERTRESKDRVWEAYALYGLGLVSAETANPERASGFFERAVRLFDETGARAMLAYACSHLGTALLSRGVLEDAGRVLERALAVHQETGNAWFEAVSMCSMGAFSLMSGEVDAAIAWFDRALPLLRRIGDERSYAVFFAHRALALVSRGARTEARADLAHALDCLRGSGDTWLMVILLGWLGGVEAELDDVDAAERSFAEADTLVPAVDAKGAVASLAAEKVILDVALARRAERRGETAIATERLERAHARFGEIDEDSPTSPEWSFYYVRLSFERARKALASRSLPPPVLDHPSGTIVVDGRGRWVLASDGRRYSLARKAALGRLLVRLVEAHAKTPAVAVSNEDLVELAWPGERVDRDVAMNRLRVAMNRLRQLGLEGAVVGQRGGYLLDPDTPIETRSPDDEAQI